MKKILSITFGIILMFGLTSCEKPSRSEVVREFLGSNDRIGKPSVIIFAGTFCSHCRNAIPKFETNIWDKYNEEVNIFVNVIDKKKFPQKRIKQGYNSKMSFKLLTNEKCRLVPSWVIMDMYGVVKNKDCGSSGEEISEIKTTLDELLKL